MTVALRSPTGYPLFDPLDIPWTHAFWAEGPEFKALGIADAAVVTTLPDEISTNDLGQTTVARKPTYRAASNLAGTPGIRFDGADDSLAGGWSNVSVPYTLALVGKLNAQVDGTTYVLVGGINTSTGRLEIMTNVTPNPDQWLGYAGANISGGDADTATHLFVVHAAAASGSSLEVDGTSIASGVTSTQVNAGLIVGIFGNATSFPANEDVSFIGFINRALTAEEKARLLAWSRSHTGVS